MKITKFQQTEIKIQKNATAQEQHRKKNVLRKKNRESISFCQANWFLVCKIIEKDKKNT